MGLTLSLVKGQPPEHRVSLCQHGLDPFSIHCPSPGQCPLAQEAPPGHPTVSGGGWQPDASEVKHSALGLRKWPHATVCPHTWKFHLGRQRAH